MPHKKFLFTSESVTEGHPDKMADQISDAVLDAILAQDPRGRVACETALTTGLVVVMGEITTTASIEIDSIARKTVREIGYDRAKYGFDADTCAVLVSVHKQSPDIAQGVGDTIETQGAGDQGMMFGYATDETPEMMPAPITFAHRLTRRLAEVRKRGTLPYLRPDGKSQVTVQYEEDRPVFIKNVVISTQHQEAFKANRIREDIIEHVIRGTLPEEMLDIRRNGKTEVHVNPTGKFVIGGPMGDAGLTGRKIIVDTYGGFARHGGGAFSGKDPTKVDRSAAYAARWVAKNVVAAGLARRCEVQVAYAIGVVKPVSLLVETFGTGIMEDERIEDLVSRVFDLRPGAILRDLDLRRPLYRQTAAYGHFGRNDLRLPWEQVDRVPLLRKAALVDTRGADAPAKAHGGNAKNKALPIAESRVRAKRPARKS